MTVIQWSDVPRSCFEWSVQRGQLSARWSTSHVQLVRSCGLDIKWWKQYVHGLVIGLLRFLTALVSYTLCSFSISSSTCIRCLKTEVRPKNWLQQCFVIISFTLGIFRPITILILMFLTAAQDLYIIRRTPVQFGIQNNGQTPLISLLSPVTDWRGHRWTL